MPKGKRPLILSEVRGAFVKDPQRRNKKPPKTRNQMLGDPPKYLTKVGKDFWEHVRMYAPEGLITNADQALVGMAASLWAQFIEKPETFSPAKVSQFRLIMREFGMTPSSRAGIEMPNGLPFENDSGFDFL